MVPETRCVNIEKLVNNICLLQTQENMIMNVWKRIQIYNVGYINKEIHDQW